MLPGVPFPDHMARHVELPDVIHLKLLPRPRENRHGNTTGGGACLVGIYFFWFHCFDWNIVLDCFCQKLIFLQTDITSVSSDINHRALFIPFYKFTSSRHPVFKKQATADCGSARRFGENKNIGELFKIGIRPHHRHSEAPPWPNRGWHPPSLKHIL